MARKKGTRSSKIAFFLAAACLLAAALLFGVLLFFQNSASPSPSPNGNASFAENGDGEEGEFPQVDWAYWKDVNADIIGWITIPGTDINHPIVQAHADAPDYYLSHDVYRNYNPLGALYLDAECEDAGLQSPNAVILGHSIGLAGTYSVFGNVQKYTDASFAKAHQVVLLQTPSTKMRYLVRFANIVKGWEPTKRTKFEGETDFQSWYASNLSSAAMVLDEKEAPNQVVSLVSCSYNYWKQNERTVVTTSFDTPSLQAK